MVLQWNTDIFRRILLLTTSNAYVQSQASRFFSASTPSLIGGQIEYDKTFKATLEEKRAYLKSIEGIVSHVNMWFSLEADWGLLDLTV